MMPSGPNDRELRRRGIRPTTSALIHTRDRTGSMDAGRSDLASRLPSFVTLHGYFHRIDVANPTITSGQSAWYGLASIDIPEDVGQELQFAGVKAELHSTDPDANGAGTGAATPLAWGADTGVGAYVVIGERLPVELNAWTSAPAYLPGVETASPGRVSGTNIISPYLWTLGFPPGKWGASTLSKLVVPQAFVPFVRRLTRGTRLDIALVVRRSQITGKTGSICGCADVQVFAGQTINTRALDA